MNKWLPKPRISFGSETKREAPEGLYPPSIKSWEIEKGGWRRDERNQYFYLNWDQLLEFERESARIATDQEFYEWFAAFRKEHGITNWADTHKRSEGKKTSWSDWDDDYWVEESGKGKPLSSWWAKDYYKGWNGASGSDSKLAIALQAVRTVVRVVDDTIPPMTVNWASNEQSYTDFANRKIVVNPKPITQKKLDDGEAIDVCTGFALHEASHSQYSREPYKALSEPTELSPMQIAGVLLNIVEDVRIEQKTVEVFPGFAGYFEKVLTWMWEDGKGVPIPKWDTLTNKINAIITICRWPDKASEVLKDPSFGPEIVWWTAWRNEYLAGKVDARTTVERGLERLREDEKTKKEMDDLAAAEAELRKEMGRLKDFIDAMIKEGIEKFAKGRACAAHGNDEPLDAKSAERVQQLVDEDYTQTKPTVAAPSGHKSVTIGVTQPKEDAKSKRAYIGKPSGILQRLKAALIFRQELPRYHDRLLKNGSLDDDELWRFAAKDYRVFSEEVIHSRPKVQLGLLVDLSGSMTYGTKLKTAQELAQLMVIATKQMDGVHVKVHGHTGDIRADDPIQVYRIWEEGDPVTRLGLISSLPHANNYDGFAIEYCVKDLLNRGEPDEQRVLIVLSDGYPAGSTYGGYEAERHMMAVSQWAEKKGVTVIQIAIDEDVRPDAQARMFKHWVQFTTMQELPNKLAKLLGKII